MLRRPVEITGGNQTLARVALGDELEQHGGFGLILADIAEVIENQAIGGYGCDEERPFNSWGAGNACARLDGGGAMRGGGSAPP